MSRGVANLPVLRFKPTVAIGSLALLALLLLSLAIPGSASAQAKSAYWQRYDVNVDINQDGTLSVTENQEIVFQGGPFQQGYAVIPLDRVEDITNVQVLEDGVPYQQATSQGTPGTFIAQVYGGEIEIRWWFDPASNETRQFTIQYDVEGAIRVYPEQDREQLWWRAIDTDFAGDIEESTVTINLPEPVPFESLLWEAYTQGIDGVTSEQIDDDTIAFHASNISQGSALEARVEYPHITQAVEPSWQAGEEAREEREEKLKPLKALANIFFLGSGLLVILGAPIGLFLYWQRKGKDFEVVLPVDILREPPDDLPPGAVGALIDEKVDTHDLIAIMIGLAERGIIHIEETEQEVLGGLLSYGRDWTVTRVDTTSSLTNPERKLLSALFGGKDEVKMSDVRQRFSKEQSKIKTAVYEELVKRGYFPRNPETVRNTWRFIAIGIIGAAIFGGIVLWGAVGSFAPLFIVLLIGIGVAGLATLIASGAMPRKTEKGADAAVRWAAFRRYLVEIDRHQDLESAREIFSKYLPYAVAFGIEKSWVRKFAEIDTPAPTWYGGYGGYGRYGRRGYPRRGPVFIPGGVGGDGSSDGGGGIGMPDLQNMSDTFAGSLQGMSDGLFDMFDQASKAFSPVSSSGGSAGGGGFSGGFSGGGGSFGGGGGGGGRGFS